jgi:hypothetical protein
LAERDNDLKRSIQLELSRFPIDMPVRMATAVVRPFDGGLRGEDTAGLLFGKNEEDQGNGNNDSHVDESGAITPTAAKWVVRCNLACFCVHFVMVWVTVYFHHWSARGEKDLKLKVFRIQIDFDADVGSGPMGRPDPQKFKYTLVDNGMPIDVGVICCTFYGLSAGFHFLSFIMGNFNLKSVYWNQMVTRSPTDDPSALPPFRPSAERVARFCGRAWPSAGGAGSSVSRCPEHSPRDTADHLAACFQTRAVPPSWRVGCAQFERLWSWCNHFPRSEFVSSLAVGIAVSLGMREENIVRRCVSTPVATRCSRAVSLAACEHLPFARLHHGVWLGH